MVVTIPFNMVDGLIEPHVLRIPPVEIPLAGLGKLTSYFGTISVAPIRLALRPAAPDHIGFHLDFDVRRNGKRVFGMYLESEVRPEIDLATGKVTIGFTPEVLQKSKPGLSEDATRALSDLIYSQIPGPVRLLIPRSMVESVVDSSLDGLLDSFYEKAKATMLPKLSEMSRLTFALPNVPLSSVKITSTDANGGRFMLAINTTLPVRDGIAATKADTKELSRDAITIRTSGSVAAEIVNWAMAKALLPNRYNDKGKPRKDGELWPGLDWVPGDEHPMKIYLWDLDKPCMRLTMSAKPSLAVVGKNLEIKAEGAETDDVEASAFIEVGVWFKLLWKDAMNVKKKSAARITTVIAGQEMTVAVERAAIEQDEIVMEVYLAAE
jgi:hypothetical protein